MGRSSSIRAACAGLSATFLCVACGGGGGGGGGTAESAFSLTVQSVSVVADAGTQIQVTIDVTPAAGFSETIALSVADAPGDASFSFAPANVTSGTSTLTIDVDSGASPASNSFTVTGTAPSATRTREMVLHTLPASASAGLALQIAPSVSIRPGASTGTMLEVDRSTSATGDVSLAVTGTPTGMTAMFDSGLIAQDTSTLLVQADPSVTPGTYPISIQGTAGSATGTTHCLVEVVDQSAATDRWISRVEFAQSYFASDLTFVSGKSVLVRAHVLADSPGVASPRVELVATNGLTELGRVDLTGPATLPQAESPDSLAASFTTELPAAWIQTGLSLEIEVDPGGADDRQPANDSAVVSPTVATGPDIELVVVPLVVGGRTGTPANYYDSMYAHWPIENLTITTRAPYTITSVSDVSSDGTGWSSVLSELASLRTSDGSTAYYYGAIDLPYNSGVFGLGYVGFGVAIGGDFSVSTMIHELGHNFGLVHAPCGGATGTDPNYPHDGGIIGRQGYDLVEDRLHSAIARRDIMGYCSSTWISGYNYEKVRANLGSSPLIQASITPPTPEPLVTIEGWVDDAGSVTFGSVRRSVGTAPRAKDSGAFTVRTVFHGLAETHPVDVHDIGCGPRDPRGARFELTVPDHGGLGDVELWRGATRLGRLAQNGDPSVSDPDVQFHETAGSLTVTWNAAAYPTLSVVHVSAKRTTLGLDLEGGTATVSTADLPYGGAFEFSVADGTCGRCVCATR